MSSLCRQPFDILEHIVNEIDWREDLLSLALTCTRLSRIIIPTHLQYRRVIISIFFGPFFEHIATRPDLAARVRELTLVSTDAAFEIPRVHAFRREYPESRLLFASHHNDEYKRARLDDTTGPWRPLGLIEKLDDALACLPRLRTLRFHLDDTHPYTLRQDVFRCVIPFERILAVHHPYLEDVAVQSRLKQLKSSEGAPWPAPTSYFWSMSGLRSLDLDVELVGVWQWDAFCTALTRSPRIEVLGVPSIDSRDGSLKPMPWLACLRRVMLSKIDTALLNMDRHPSVVELCCRGLFTADVSTPLPRLPALKRMLNIRESHILEVLRRCRRDGDTMPVLSHLTFDNVLITLHEWDWADLSPVLPCLRALHIRSMDKARHEGPRLNEVTWRFPHIHSLAGVYVDPKLEAIVMEMLAFSEAAGNVMDHTVTFQTFKAVSHLLRGLKQMQPRLRDVNGWSLESDLAQEAVFSFPTPHALAPLPSTRLILTRDRLHIGYVGSSLDTQPLSLVPKRPRPIARTTYRDFGD
ncbi:unnamed protein product [Peniophora sp. CBMAI 1063]|nr:unnamed protein product [Peniophora sp. CBMAI 1063]